MKLFLFKWAQEFLENYLVLCLKKWSWPWIKAFRLLHAAWPKGLVSNNYELLVPKACFDKFIIGLYVFKCMICKVFLGVFMIQHTNYNNIKLYVEAIMMHTIQTCDCYDASITWLVTYDLTTYKTYIFTQYTKHFMLYNPHTLQPVFSIILSSGIFMILLSNWWTLTPWNVEVVGPVCCDHSSQGPMISGKTHMLDWLVCNMIQIGEYTLW